MSVNPSQAVIDKFAFVVPVSEERQEDCFKRSATLRTEKGVRAYSRHYKSSTTVRFASDPSAVLLVSLAPNFPNNKFARFEFNPTNLQIADLRSIVEFVLDIPLETTLSMATINRIDVAVDLPGVSVNDLFCRAPNFRVSRSYYSSANARETEYIGKRNSPLCIKMYDKVAQMKHWNSTHLQKFEIPNHALTRIEAEVRPRCFFSELPALANPFSRFQIGYIANFPAKNDLDSFFIDSVRLHGWTHAFAKASDSNKIRFKQLMNHAACDWWNPETMFYSWPSLLKEFDGLGVFESDSTQIGREQHNLRA